MSSVRSRVGRWAEVWAACGATRITPGSSVCCRTLWKRLPRSGRRLGRRLATWWSRGLMVSGSLLTYGATVGARLTQLSTTSFNLAGEFGYQQTNGVSPTAEQITLTLDEKLERIREAIQDARDLIYQVEQDERISVSDRELITTAAGRLRRGDTEINFRSLPEGSRTGGHAGLNYRNGNPEVTIIYSNESYFNDDGTVNIGILAATLVHEARHIYDLHFYGQEGIWTIRDARRTERNAYRVQAVFAEAIGLQIEFSSPDGLSLVLNRQNSNLKAEIRLEYGLRPPLA